MLTLEQLRAREGRLTTSSVACLMTGDEERILNLWRLLVGDPDYGPEDLSGVWRVRLGDVTEPLNLEWYSRKTGRPLSRHGEVVICPAADWAACTLDAWDADLDCPVEAKHVSGRELRTKIIERYQPQCHWQMLVTGARRVLLSLIEGTNEPTIEEISFDEIYAQELWRRAELFMECVVSLTPPLTLPEVLPPIPKNQMRRFNLDDLSARGEIWPNWARAMEPELLNWKNTVDQAKLNASAAKAIKEILPLDVGYVVCDAVCVSRAKNGAVSIKVKE